MCMERVLRQCVSIPLLEVPEKLLQVLHAANGNDTAVYYFGIMCRPYFLGYIVLELTQLNPLVVFSLKLLIFLKIIEMSYCLADLLGH